MFVYCISCFVKLIIVLVLLLLFCFCYKYFFSVNYRTTNTTTNMTSLGMVLFNTSQQITLPTNHGQTDTENTENTLKLENIDSSMLEQIGDFYSPVKILNKENSRNMSKNSTFKSENSTSNSDYVTPQTPVESFIQSIFSLFGSPRYVLFIIVVLKLHYILYDLHYSVLLNLKALNKCMWFFSCR